MMPLMTITTASTPSMVSSNKIFQRLTPRTRLSAVEMMAEEEALLGEGMESMENNGIIKNQNFKFIFFSEQQHRIRTKSPLSGSNRNYGSLERRQQCSTSETVDYVTSPPNHSSYDIDFKGQSNNTSEHFGVKKTKIKNYDKIYDKIYGKIYNKFYDKSDDKNDENTQNDNKKEENLTNIPAALIVGRREISTQTEAVRRRLQQRRQSRYKRLTGSDESKEAGRSRSVDEKNEEGGKEEGRKTEGKEEEVKRRKNFEEEDEEMEKDEEVEDEEEKEKREEDRRKKMRERMKEAEGEEEIKKRLEEGRMKDLNKGKTKEERRMNKPFALKIENGDEEEEEESDKEENGRKEEREGREGEQSEDLPYSEEELSVDFRRGLGDSEEEEEEEYEKESSSDDRIECRNNKDNLERREKITNDQMIVRC
ncbi:unnamed protein product [Meloidogyne enterolobii]|uniref:Uncharacterized protein n=1 Tax=Meloidogyne enterolobii TaxID=390850 RepID=A0ACB1AJL0_MELEN